MDKQIQNILSLYQKENTLRICSIVALFIGLLGAVCGLINSISNFTYWFTIGTVCLITVFVSVLCALVFSIIAKIIHNRYKAIKEVGMYCD